eukprot:16444817-Heterocapsa_arctica.AAC.1
MPEDRSKTFKNLHKPSKPNTPATSEATAGNGRQQPARGSRVLRLVGDFVLPTTGSHVIAYDVII